MIFKKKAIYKGTRYIRVEEDYTGLVPNTRCEIYNCKYDGTRGLEGCDMCNKVLRKTHAHKLDITFGYMPID